MQTVQELAERISLISVSSTMKVAADADRLRREGDDVVDFSAGEPDFPTPENIKQAAIDAIKQNFTKYTPVRHRRAEAGHLRSPQADYGTAYTAKECIATVGGKHAIFNLTQALLDPATKSSFRCPIGSLIRMW